MQTAIEATQAIISSIRRDYSVRLHLSIKESDYTLSELRWKVSGGAVCPQWRFCKRGMVSGGVGEGGIDSHFRAIISSLVRRIIKLFKAIFLGKLKN